MRQCRQAKGVTAISASTDTAGSLAVTLADGSTAVWARNAGADEVNFGIGAATDLLAEYIEELTFTGYEADGVTTTATPADIRSVNCRVRVELPRHRRVPLCRLSRLASQLVRGETIMRRNENHRGACSWCASL